MKISVLTIFPELFGDFLNAPVIRRALDRGIAGIEIVDIRPFAGGSFRHIDDSPFGGGAGMIMRCQPVLDALEDVLRRDADREASTQDFSEAQNHSEAEKHSEVQMNSGEQNHAESQSQNHRVLIAALSPRGVTYTQATAREWSSLDHLVLICGHYEGMDERIYNHVDMEISIGDYVLTGGELAAQVITDSIVRLLPGVLRAASTEEESFENGLLEYPQYTQPADFRGEKVPEVLLSGNHEKIRQWRSEQALRITRERRPDLLSE